MKDINKKTNNLLKNNIMLTISACLLSIVFLLLCLTGNSWAWFTVDKSYTNTISTAYFNLVTSMNKLSSNNLLLAANILNDEEIDFHIQEIEEIGDYNIEISSINDINGNCKLTIEDDNNVLVSANINVNSENPTSFNIHTFKPLTIKIDNINWGDLQEFGEIQEDYYFGSYTISYDSGIEEYSILPTGYQELEYLESDGSQYCEVIKENEKEIFSFIDHIDIVENNEVITYKTLSFTKNTYEDHLLVPCLNLEQNKQGIYDLTSNIFYPNLSETSFNQGQQVKHYQYKDNKDLHIDKELITSETYNLSNEETENIKDYDYEILGYHFKCWQYEDYEFTSEDSVSEIENLLKQNNMTSITLKAVNEKNVNYFVLDNTQIEIKAFESITIEPPTQENKIFKAYLDQSGQVIFDETGTLINNPFILSMNNEQIILHPLFEEVINEETENTEENNIEQ